MMTLPITGRLVYPVYNRDDLATSVRWNITDVDTKNRMVHIDFDFQLMYKQSFTKSGYQFYFGKAENAENWYFNVDQTAPVATAQRINMVDVAGNAFASTNFSQILWQDHFYDNLYGYEIEAGYEDWECKSFNTSDIDSTNCGFGAKGWTVSGDYVYSQAGTVDITLTWEGAALSLLSPNNVFIDYGFFGRTAHTASFTISFGVPTDVSISNGYLGDVLNVKLINYTIDPTLLIHTIEYKIGNTTGYIAQNTSLKELQWTVPMEFMSEFPTGKQYMPCEITCYTYTQEGSLVGSTTISRYYFLDVDTNGIFTNLNVYAIDELTPTLTKDKYRMIKFISTTKVEVEVLAHEDISRIIISNNGIDYIALTSDMCTEEQFPGGLPNVYKTSFIIPNIENGYFANTAFGEDGNTHVSTYETGLIPYWKLTMNPHSFKFDPNGIVSCEIDGICYNGSFDGTATVFNSPTLYYRTSLYREDIDTEEWIKSTNIISQGDNIYDIDFSVSGYDVQKKYYFQFKIVDACMEVVGNIIVVIGKPVFDWSNETFHFGVPIEADREMVFDADKGIDGVDQYGNQIRALTPCDSIGNTVLGYGNYQAESGNTMIYGNEIDIFSNYDITINGRIYGENRVLWQGASHMNGNQSITLSERISQQPNGIVLVFSYYEGNYAQDTSFNTCFISKKQVELFPSCGHTFLMGINAGFSAMGAKYLYFSDTTISGHSGNTSNGTNSGITFNNSNYVLRMVIGV